MSYTRCQDRACPLQQNCVRYDARPMEAPGQGYFAKSPRSRDSCQYFFPYDHTASKPKPTPLTSDWPTDKNITVIE
jgi:hypothetical protein